MSYANLERDKLRHIRDGKGGAPIWEKWPSGMNGEGHFYYREAQKRMQKEQLAETAEKRAEVMEKLAKYRAEELEMARNREAQKAAETHQRKAALADAIEQEEKKAKKKENKSEKKDKKQQKDKKGKKDKSKKKKSKKKKKDSSSSDSSNSSDAEKAARAEDLEIEMALLEAKQEMLKRKKQEMVLECEAPLKKTASSSSLVPGPVIVRHPRMAHPSNDLTEVQEEEEYF
eukprot:gnl/MRDRNA2_/MRDRNA2_78402_c0_seq1.p1 gnl/MRDRNA2_/MRDRNA2_78402_c0~~gnl/MRDRNA2_/MRDRNA2_78402_c0_seq1.p1  ORF type:complete len:230 (-),score=83.70 gnl/MRDRNA2_/MRDRNA2_78402_c0_seq1:11-700(-)